MQAASSSNKRWVLWAALCLLLLHFCVALGSKFFNSVTTDELVHYSSGYSYWHYNDYRLHPENGNLPQRWAALPALARSDVTFPSTDVEGWRQGGAWNMGYRFFYFCDNDHFPLLMSGRAMIALLSAAAGFLVFHWSRSLYGDRAGLFSLVLYCFCPDTLAQGALVTSDMAATLFFLLCLGLYWKHLHDGRYRTLALSSLCFGLAWVTKYSAITLLPVFGILALLRCLNPEPLRLGPLVLASFRRKGAALATSLLVHALVAVGVIWVFYGFRYSASNPLHPPAAEFGPHWAAINQSIGFPGKVLSFLAGLQLLPEAFLYGFAYVFETIKQRAAFLNGDYSTTGWVSFFPYTFLYKTPLALFPIIIGAALCWVSSWWSGMGELRSALKKSLYPIAPLLLFFIVYWILSLTSHLNIGHRHILPTYPVLFVLCGALLAPALRAARPSRPAFIWLLAILFSAESLLVFPHFISFYNPIAGGPAQGWRHLVDSSTDWGQNMPQLADWLAQRRQQGDTRPAFLSYFGAASPRYYGIQAERLPCVTVMAFPHAKAELKPGIYCISATMLQNVYSKYSGPWTQRHEDDYRALVPLEAQIHSFERNPEERSRLAATSSERQWELAAEQFDQLRFTRLCHYLRARGPDEVIGGSILIFNLDEGELTRALHLPLEPWRTWLRESSRGR